MAVENIPTDESNVALLSPDKHPTIKITHNGIEYIKFGSSQEEMDEILECDAITIVGTCNKNEWMGNTTPQIKIEDYELIEYIDKEWVF